MSGSRNFCSLYQGTYFTWLESQTEIWGTVFTLLPVRPDLTLASIIWSQKKKKKKVLSKGKESQCVFSPSPSRYPSSIIPHKTFLLCHSQSPNEAISQTRLPPAWVPFSPRPSGLAPQHVCCFPLLPLLGEADLHGRHLALSTDVLCQGLMQYLLLAQVCFQ